MSCNLHNCLKSKIPQEIINEDYFMYSKETGKIFYTNGQIDGNGKTLYTYEFIGLSGLKLGTAPLINGMSVPVTEPLQTIEGQVPLNTEVAISVNGTPATVTYENVTFDGPVNIMAGVKTKKFSADVLLNNVSNVITIKADSAITNIKVNLGESNGGQVIPDPVIKPVAVISMTPEQGLTTATNITWGYENSTTAEGRTIVAAEWEGKESIYSTEGTYTARLRVQDSKGIWSDWVEKSFAVFGYEGVF